MSALFSNGEMVGGSVENTDFTSSDVADGQATSWTTVTPIVDDEPNVSLFTKLSQIAKNVRYLYKMVTEPTGISGYFELTSGLKVYINKIRVSTSSTGSGAFQYYGYESVTFPTGVSFTSVLAGLSNINANAGYQNSTIRNLTTTGCDVYAGSNGSSSYDVTYVIIGI